MNTAETRIERAKVSQEWRLILEGDKGTHPKNAYRKVQLLVPPGITVYITLAENADVSMGLNRTYKGVPLSDGNVYPFTLQPHQRIWAACEKGEATLGLIIESLVD